MSGPGPLFAAGQNPGRLRSVIVGSGAASFPLQISGALKDLVEAPDLGPIATWVDPGERLATGGCERVTPARH